MPRGEVVRVRPLRGGISSSVHLVRLRDGEGVEQAVVVRRYGEYWQRTDPAACEREYRLLERLAEIGFPAPRPLLLDREGRDFGAPTVVMSRLPGRPDCAPRDREGYLRQLARTLAQLHALATDGLDFLREQTAIYDRSLADWDDQRPIVDELHRSVVDEARKAWVEVRNGQHRKLVHGDYWPGNVLFSRGRLTGVVDWEQPRLGDPAKDVATCRADLAVLFGPQEADAFVDYYVEAGGQPVRNLRFWDLLCCTWAVPEMPQWALAYRVLRRPDLSSDVASAKIRAFASYALNRPPAG
jgi:aminoglycoside phosphotransferase (APT) family kinase protein